MSMGSIIFTSVGWFVHSGKLLYGNDFFKRPCSIIKIIFIEILRFYYVYLFAYCLV